MIEVGGSSRASVESGITFTCTSIGVEIWQSRVSSKAIGARSRGIATSLNQLIALASAGAGIEVGRGSSASVLRSVAFATAGGRVPVWGSARASQSGTLACASSGVEVWQGRVLRSAVSAGISDAASHLKCIATA